MNVATSRSLGFFGGTKRARKRKRTIVDWDAFIDELDEEHEAIVKSNKRRVTSKRVESSLTLRGSRDDSAIASPDGETTRNGHEDADTIVEGQKRQRSLSPKRNEGKVLKRCSFWRSSGRVPRK